MIRKNPDKLLRERIAALLEDLEGVSLEELREIRRLLGQDPERDEARFLKMVRSRLGDAQQAEPEATEAPLGDDIFEAITNAGLTPELLAERAGLSPNLLRKLLGRVFGPESVPRAVIERMASALSLGAEQLGDMVFGHLPPIYPFSDSTQFYFASSGSRIEPYTNRSAWDSELCEFPGRMLREAEDERPKEAPEETADERSARRPRRDETKRHPRRDRLLSAPLLSSAPRLSQDRDEVFYWAARKYANRGEDFFAAVTQDETLSPQLREDLLKLKSEPKWRS